MKGLIMKGIGGFYYVKDETGKVVQCKARGIFKNESITPYVGDSVEFEMIDGKEGIIEKIHPRKNQFIRPPISNVDVFVIVASIGNPKPNIAIIDKFMVMAEHSNTEIVLCINKVDNGDEKQAKEIEGIYKDIYPVVKTSGINNRGIDELKKLIKGKKAAFAGPSGVGKSTLLNAIEPKLNLETGSISNKTKRGKHTTRHVEIMQTDFGGMLYDTPGFTSFEILEVSEEKLQYMYPDIQKHVGNCKYDNCIHVKEPECGVLEKVKSEDIHPSRYNSYIKQIEEIRSKKKY